MVAILFVNPGRGDGYEKKSVAMLGFHRLGAQPAPGAALSFAAGNADCPTCNLRSITVDPSGSNRTTALGIDDWRRMTGGRTYDSTADAEHAYFLNGPGGEFTKFDPPWSIDTGGLRISDPGGIAGFCLRAGATL